MIDGETKQRVSELVAAIADRPSDLPLKEVAALSAEPVTVDLDRTGSETVVYVSPRRASCFDVLSKRESEVATLVAAGFSNQQIADTLFISLATVKDHVHAILAKTGLASRSAVAAAWYAPTGR